MNRKKAVRILLDMCALEKDQMCFLSGGSLSGEWHPGQPTISLDDAFTADQLEALAWWMRNAGGGGDTYFASPTERDLERIRKEWHERIEKCEAAALAGHPCGTAEAEAIRACSMDIANSIRKANGKEPFYDLKGGQR